LNLINRYMALCKKVGMKDGLKVVNAYLDKEFGHHRVTTCSDPAEKQRFANVFTSLEAMGQRELRAFLLPPAEHPSESVNSTHEEKENTA